MKQLSFNARVYLSGLESPGDFEFLIKGFSAGEQFVSAAAPLTAVPTLIMLAHVGRAVGIVDDEPLLHKRLLDALANCDAGRRCPPETGRHFGCPTMHLACLIATGYHGVREMSEYKPWIAVFDELMNL